MGRWGLVPLGVGENSFRQGLGPAGGLVCRAVSGEGPLSRLDLFQGRLVVTYLMLGTFQRKVLFDEYATCDQREVCMVRRAAAVLSGGPGGKGALLPLRP